MGNEVFDHCARLKARLLKEQERGPLPMTDRGDTTAVGGWGKIGKGLEGLAEAMFDELAAVASVDVSSARTDYGVARNPTIGRWHDALVDLGRVAMRTGRVSGVIKVLLDDLGRDKASALHRLANVRNRLQHAVKNRPSAQEAAAVLQGGLDLLERAQSRRM